MKFSNSILPISVFFGFANFAFSQSITDTEKLSWLAREGCLHDKWTGSSCNDNMTSNRAFAIMTNGDYSSGTNRGAINTYFKALPASTPWFDGARESGMEALQAYYWFGDILDSGVKDTLYDALSNMPGDDYYWAQAWNNGTINCVTVKYIMARKMAGTETCRYGPGENGYDAPATFTWEGTTYTAGQTYNTEELCRDWLYMWMSRFVTNQYLHGEMRSETYSYHFINCLITLADDRMVSDATMRERAALTADLFLLEHGMASNGHHLGGPLGRTYLSSHVSGNYFFFPFDAYFGGPYQVHYGNKGGFYISQYRLPTVCEDAGRYGDESSGYTHIIKTKMQNAYTYVTKKFTLGSGPDGGSWCLEINSGNSGPFPIARPGFNFRIWMNNYVDDLNQSANPGDYESQMGQSGHQYKDAIYISGAGLILHEALANNSWDAQEGNASTWLFKQENGVAVAITMQDGQNVIEASRIGIDEPTYADFKSKFGSNPYSGTGARFIDENTYKTRRGTFITDSSGITYYKDGSGAFVKLKDSNYPRLGVVDITTPGSPVDIITNPSTNQFTITRHGLTINYDFDNWVATGDTEPPAGDTTPPAAPSNFRVTQ